jgi:opacity protein-like surface antigen
MKQLIISLSATALLTAVGYGADQASEKKDYIRKDKGEIFAFGQYTLGDTTVFSGAGTVKFEPAFGGGLGMGYHFSEYVCLNWDTSFSAPETIYDLRNGAHFENSTTVWGMNLSVDYNILRTRVTPFITGGFGFNYFTGDIRGEGTEFSEFDLAYGAGGGIRWDINRHWALKGMYRANWTSLQDADNTMLFNTFTLGIHGSF